MRVAAAASAAPWGFAEVGGSLESVAGRRASAMRARADSSDVQVLAAADPAAAASIAVAQAAAASGASAISGAALSGCARHKEFRIAMLMPWITDDRSATRFPAWLPYFTATAARSSMLVDWLIIHEGPLVLGELPPQARSANVKLFDVGQGGIASLIAAGLGAQLHLPTSNTSTLASRMRFMFQKWPRLVAEYKPAFGAIFSQYLINYTHWGYSDLDVILGDVAAFISRSELMTTTSCVLFRGLRRLASARSVDGAPEPAKYQLHLDGLRASFLWPRKGDSAEGCISGGMRLQGGSRTTSASSRPKAATESRHANLRHKSEDLAKAVCRPRAGPAGECSCLRHTWRALAVRSRER